MNNILHFNNTIDSVSIKKYQALSDEDKLECLHQLNQKDVSFANCSITHDEDIALTVSAFFINELITHNIENLKESQLFQKSLPIFLFQSHPKKRKNFEVKKPIIDFLFKKNLINYNVLNFMAFTNDLKTIKQLINYGANPDYVEKEDSFASCAIKGGNFSVFNFAINRPNFNPLVGENVLYLAIMNGHNKAIDSLIYASNPILSNEEFINKAKKLLDEKDIDFNIDEIIMPKYEQFLLEKEIKVVPEKKTKIKL